VPTPLVQQRGDPGIGVGIEEAIDLGDHFGARLPGRPSRLRQGQAQRPRRPTLEPDLDHDLFTFDQSHIFDQEPRHPFPLPLRRLGVLPESREVGRQRQDPAAALLVQDGMIGLASSLILLLGLGQRTQSLVPIRFQGVRH
jgi:hypothetical protein